MPSEPRWIILAQAGRRVAMGHAASPSEAEVEAAAAALAAQGMAGWLATPGGYDSSRARPAGHDDHGAPSCFSASRIAPIVVAQS